MGYCLKYSNLMHKVCALFKMIFYMFYFVFFFGQRNSNIVESVPKVFLSLFYFLFFQSEFFFSIFEIFKESTSLGRFQVFCSQYLLKSISIYLSIFSTEFKEKLLFILFTYFFEYFFLTDFFSLSHLNIIFFSISLYLDKNYCIFY